MHAVPDNRRTIPRPGARGDRRRPGWREFRRAYPGVVVTLGVALVAMLALDGLLVVRRARYQTETERLRASMTDVERRRTDAILEAERNALLVQVEMLRRQALGDRALNLAVSVDSGRMVLAREGARLRDMRVDVGPERWVRNGDDSLRVAVPRGARTVERVLTAADAWEVPTWVWLDRGLPAPADRAVKGALGPTAVLLSGGTVIYAPPMAGPLNDAGYVLPGGIRARAEDLAAIAPNLAPGVTVYFY